MLVGWLVGVVCKEDDVEEVRNGGSCGLSGGVDVMVVGIVDVCGVRIVVREWFVCPENGGIG